MDESIEVKVGCPECGTKVTKTLSEARGVINEHNESMHDGTPVAGIMVRGPKRMRYFPHPKDASEEIVAAVREAILSRAGEDDE